jgi:hypothetical protein
VSRIAVLARDLNRDVVGAKEYTLGDVHQSFRLQAGAPRGIVEGCSRDAEVIDERGGLAPGSQCTEQTDRDASRGPLVTANRNIAPRVSVVPRGLLAQGQSGSA